MQALALPQIYHTDLVSKVMKWWKLEAAQSSYIVSYTTFLVILCIGVPRRQERCWKVDPTLKWCTFGLWCVGIIPHFFRWFDLIGWFLFLLCFHKRIANKQVAVCFFGCQNQCGQTVMWYSWHKIHTKSYKITGFYQKDLVEEDVWLLVSDMTWLYCCWW